MAVVLLGVDPGVKGVATAVLDARGELLFSRFFRTPSSPEGLGWAESVQEAVRSLEGLPLTRVWIEFPQVYGRSKAPAEDLLRIAAVSGALAVSLRASFPEAAVRFVLPYAWKRNVPKEVMLRRIFDALSPEEKSRIEEKRITYVGDALDAVGIAKWAFKHNPGDGLE